jgi:uncharacterized small protein (DUF1192 family)
MQDTITSDNVPVQAPLPVPLPVPLPAPLQMGEQEYYNSKDLLAYKPEFYYGCTSKPRNIITKKKIPKEEYAYATFEKLTRKWNPTEESCKKAQLLISKQWVDQFYFKLESAEKKKILVQEPIQLQQFTTPPPPSSHRDFHLVHLDKEDNEHEFKNEKFGHVEVDDEEEEGNEKEGQQYREIENAPPLLHLDDGEKFHDADGNVIEIETRGERDRKKIYFKVKDVSVGFVMPSLSKNILRHRYVDVENGYEYGLHYKAFKRVPSGESNKQEMTLYLTYKGLLRVLFVSRNKNVDKFQDWAEEKLFTIQMGTRDQKVKLGAEVLNTSPRTLKAIFDKHAATFPSIYLMSLGKVRELRETFGIPANKPDDSTVYKFGFTDDLSRRVIELEADYSKLPGVTMTIGTFHIIETKYTSEAENEVREMCAVFEVRVKKTTQGFNELIILDDKQFANMKKMYRRIGDEFAGATLGLQKQIAELKERIKDYENEIVRLKLEIEYKDNLHKKDIELKDTVIENWKLKHQLATSSFSSPRSDRFETEYSMVRC